MPTVAVEPDSVASLTHNNWVLGAGANKAVACAAPDDDDTTYLRTIDVTAQDLKSEDANWPSAVGFVNSVTCRARWRSENVASHTLTYGVENGSGVSTDTDGTSGTTYVNDSTAALSRPGGGLWTAVDFARDTTWMHFFTDGSGANGVRVTSMRINIDYETPSGVVPFFLSFLWGGLVYPFLADFAAHLEAVSASQRRFLVRPDEAERYYRLYREMRFPVFSMTP